MHIVVVKTIIEKKATCKEGTFYTLRGAGA